MNDGYTIKATDAGYTVEHFDMNSQSHTVTILETHGPFPTPEAAERKVRAMRALADLGDNASFA